MTCEGVRSCERQSFSNADLRDGSRSTVGQESEKERARLAGFDLHLTKPVDPVALQKALSRQ